jgi:tRNA modification GTPase
MTPATARRCYVCLATAPVPGPVAIVQLRGEDAADVARELTGGDVPLHRLAFRDMAGIDEGLVAHPAERFIQLMPHGGPRVVQTLLDRLAAMGCEVVRDADAADVFPEAASPIEADALAAIALAASPAAVDVLAAQPALWRSDPTPPPNGSRLDRLLDPPCVVVVGRPNVGKSTLTNAMLGRTVSIVADLPGTTRDWVAGLAELVPPGGGPHHAVAVRWLDTPGLRDSDDEIEQNAIALARTALASADVLIALRDPAIDWPDPAGLPRAPDLWAINKCDATDHPGRGTADDPLRIAAREDRHLDRLAGRVIAALGLDAVNPPPRWAFSATLRRFVAGEPVDLAAYLAEH